MTIRSTAPAAAVSAIGLVRLRERGARVLTNREVKKLMADENVNVVDICSYPYQHAKQAILAAEAGKHIFLDKPIANTVAEGLEITRICRDANVRLSIGFQRRRDSDSGGQICPP